MRPVLHPAIEDVRPEAVLHALADPDRAAIFAGILRAGCVETCTVLSALGERAIPKSSLSNHVRVLREAGLIHSERHGVELRNRPRLDELEARFPGLITAILTAYASHARCTQVPRIGS